MDHEKKYDLEERTFRFARDVASFVKSLQKDIVTIEYGKQVVRSSGSVGANYREANEALSKKDFIMRIKICRKESKESEYWLRLINETTENFDVKEGRRLQDEADQLKKIFSSILVKSE